MDYVLGTKKRSAPQEETEYDDYAQVESKKVSEEEVLKKLEDSYQHQRLRNPPRLLMTMMIPCPTSLSWADSPI